MNQNRSNVGGLIGGAVLIGLGLLTLIDRLIPGIDLGNLWPLFIMGFGALFFIAMFAIGKSGAGFAVPGTIISGIGLILLYQSITEKWQSMSYFWALIVFFVGLGIYIMGWYGEDADQKRSGGRLMKIGAVLFIIFGIIFETLFSSMNSMIFPILLILLGGYLVISRSGFFSRKQDETKETPLPPTS